MFGLMVGGSTAAIFAPMMACVTGWFDTHRSLAVSLVSAGMGMAPMIMSPLAAWLVSHHDWRTSMQIVAVVVAAIMIPVSLLVRRPPALESGHVRRGRRRRARLRCRWRKRCARRNSSSCSRPISSAAPPIRARSSTP